MLSWNLRLRQPAAQGGRRAFLARVRLVKWPSCPRYIHLNQLITLCEFTIAIIAIENDHRNSGFSHEKWWFSTVMLNYQRVILMHVGQDTAVFVDVHWCSCSPGLLLPQKEMISIDPVEWHNHDTTVKLEKNSKFTATLDTWKNPSGRTPLGIVQKLGRHTPDNRITWNRIFWIGKIRCCPFSLSYILQYCRILYIG